VSISDATAPLGGLPVPRGAIGTQARVERWIDTTATSVSRALEAHGRDGARTVIDAIPTELVASPVPIHFGPPGESAFRYAALTWLFNSVGVCLRRSRHESPDLTLLTASAFEHVPWGFLALAGALETVQEYPAVFLSLLQRATAYDEVDHVEFSHARRRLRYVDVVALGIESVLSAWRPGRREFSRAGLGEVAHEIAGADAGQIADVMAQYVAADPNTYLSHYGEVPGRDQIESHLSTLSLVDLDRVRVAGSQCIFRALSGMYKQRGARR
jgi:hypothetical protein